jgi:predicted transposase/invertase (TIGR01784 family)
MAQFSNSLRIREYKEKKKMSKSYTSHSSADKQTAVLADTPSKASSESRTHAAETQGAAPQTSLAQEKQKAVARMTMFNHRFMHHMLIDDPDLVEEIMQKLLSDPEFKVAKYEIEKNIPGELSRGKEVKLDVFIEDDKGGLHDLEFQSEKEGAPASRMLVYLAYLILLAAQKGEEYRDIPEVQTIFVFQHDFFATGKARATFTFQSEEDHTPLEVKANIIVINGGSTEDGELGSILHDLKTADPEQMHSVRLAEKTALLKSLTKGVSDMDYLDEIYDNLMRQQYLMQGQERGLEQGRIEGRNEVWRSAQKKIQEERALAEEKLKFAEEKLKKEKLAEKQKLQNKMRAAGYSEEQIQLLFSEESE